MTSYFHRSYYLLIDVSAANFNKIYTIVSEIQISIVKLKFPILKSIRECHTTKWKKDISAEASDVQNFNMHMILSHRGYGHLTVTTLMESNAKSEVRCRDYHIRINRLKHRLIE